MKKSLVKELTRLEAAFDNLEAEPMTDSAVRRMTSLQKMRRNEEVAGVHNFTTRKVGEEVGYGTIVLCPVCNEPAAERYSKNLRATLFVHSMKVVPTLGTLVRSGNSMVAGPGGNLQIDEFHMSSNGVPVMPAPRQVSTVDVDRGWKEFYTNHVDTKKLAPIVDPDLQPTKVVRKAKAAPAPVAPVVKVVPEWRRAAAQRAWETIRAKRALAAVAA